MKKFILLAVFVIVAVSASAQQYVLNTVVDGSGATFNTVVNAATATLSYRCPSKNVGTSSVIQVVATKASGTIAGTLSLFVSNNGVDWKAATIAEAGTALNTYTATDVASQTFLWRLTGAPYLYYQVSWTGAATMNATFTATAYIH
jgi:hypothetical protein